jgi:hypothetical protein
VRLRLDIDANHIETSEVIPHSGAARLAEQV